MTECGEIKHDSLIKHLLNINYVSEAETTQRKTKDPKPWEKIKTHNQPEQHNECYEKIIYGIKDDMRTQKKKCITLPGNVRNTELTLWSQLFP